MVTLSSPFEPSFPLSASVDFGSFSLISLCRRSLCRRSTVISSFSLFSLFSFSLALYSVVSLLSFSSLSCLSVSSFFSRPMSLCDTHVLSLLVLFCSELVRRGKGCHRHLRLHPSPRLPLSPFVGSHALFFSSLPLFVSSLGQGARFHIGIVHSAFLVAHPTVTW